MKLKKLLLCSIVTLLSTISFAQIQWAWMKGSSSIGQQANYGTLGVSANNNIPGARERAISWTDVSGNMWLFGGEGYDGAATIGDLNDLWQYNPVNNQWTWESGSNVTDQLAVYGTIGVGSTTNIPGSRHNSVSWVDATGDLWLFGGAGYATTPGANGLLNDLWKYSISNNQWTWVTGSNTTDQFGVYGSQGVASVTNTPGARHGAITWTDHSGNLWLFGGYGYASSNDYLNDLWKYNPTTNEWTWVSGSNGNSQLGTYGTQGVASVLNVPGARWKSKAYTDASGNLWLFGGSGYASNVGGGYLNDLWKYNISTNQWTWMNGSNITDQIGTYGNLGVPTATDLPGAREQFVGWVDNLGDFWLWGGDGYDRTGPPDALSDLWKYEPALNQWTWMNGPTVINQPGTYGSVGVASINNIPGARYSNVGFKDASGDLWLFGGFGTASTTSNGYLNDSWKMSMSCAAPLSPTNTTPSSNSVICTGNSATLSASGSGTINWYSTAVSTTTIGVGANYVTPILTTGTYTYYAEAKTCTTSITRTPIMVKVSLCTDIKQLANSINEVSIYPNPTKDVLYIESPNLPENSIVEIYNTLNQKVTIQKLNGTAIKLNNLSGGVYYLRVINNDVIIHQTKIIKQD